MVTLLVAANIVVWLFALARFHHTPTLLGVAAVVYGLGLRHAVDVDHIAAIDNVTRKLMQHDERPVTVGFWFALGHSTIVFAATAAVAWLASSIAGLERYRSIVGDLSAGISAFLFVGIAAVNIELFRRLWRCFRQQRLDPQAANATDFQLQARGLLARLLGPLLRMVRKSWHMALIGLLFGLGFDTASEVALIGTSATQLAHGVPFSAALLFPLLFAAGMTLVDTADGIVMLKVYDWALLRPVRTLIYNMVITALSAAIALAVGTAALARLASGVPQLGALFHAMVARSDWLGIGLLCLFLSCLGCSWFAQRARRLTE